MTGGTEGRTRRWTLNVVTVAFAIALALLFVLVLRSIAVQIVPPPKPIAEPYPDVSTREKCDTAGGRWVEQPVREQVSAPQTPVLGGEKFQPTCQGPLAFEREREAQTEQSQQVSLFVFAIGGGLAVASSILLLALRPVAPGLMLGGIASFFIAGIHIWMLAPGLGRLITIVVIFLVLVGTGMFALRERPAADQENLPR